jgi:hypothetical protein
MSRPRIFVSHSNQDNLFTKKLVDDLKAMGADVWVDYEQIASGNFAKSINEGLGTCEWVILVQTPNALASSWVREEIDAAANLRVKRRVKEVIPIIAEDCAGCDVPPMWDTLHNYDATTDYERAIAGIGRALGLLKTGGGQPQPTTRAVPVSLPRVQPKPEPRRSPWSALIMLLVVIAFGSIFMFVRSQSPLAHVRSSSVKGAKVPHNPDSDQLLTKLWAPGGTLSNKLADQVTPEAVSSALDAGADPDARNSGWNETTLTYAAHNDLQEVAGILLQAGAKIDDDQNKGGTTPLMEACLAGHEGMVKYLIDRGASVNFANQKGETALIQAAAYCRPAVLRILLANGADITAVDAQGQSAIDHAMKPWRYYGRMPRPADQQASLDLLRAAAGS